MLISMNSSMKTFSLSIANIFSLYFFIFSLDFMNCCVQESFHLSHLSHKGRVKSRKVFCLNSHCCSFVIIYVVLDVCQKISKRSSLWKDIQNLRINWQGFRKEIVVKTDQYVVRNIVWSIDVHKAEVGVHKQQHCITGFLFVCLFCLKEGQYLYSGSNCSCLQMTFCSCQNTSI